MPPDTLTRRWIKTPADERAVANGCYFDERAGLHVVEFARRFIRHSSGEWAGKPFELMDWQRDDLILPLFGWKRPDGTRRFRIAYVELPKKNGKSATASFIGLYLLVGDGEPGAEVYSAATSQQQASIVHNEAINMVDASPELSSVLKINRTTKNIAFPDAKSFYRALSAEAKGSEGIKAHAVIADELHVWQGRKLWDSLKYAFRTRRQPLLFCITTAGDDVHSVCYSQHEYAAGILNGTIEDDRFFAYIRAAEPDDDWTDEKVWHKANPSLGITLKLDDFKADVAEAKKSPTQQSAFKRYSLNIWATSTNPWLKLEDWQACRETYTEADLLGRPCYGGLDLAKTRDMTAFVLVFPDGPDCYRLLPYFWLPHDVAYDPDSPAEYRVWAEQGHLRTTPGNVCDYAFIKRDIAELAGRFDIREYGFDPYNAEQLTQELEDQHDLKRFAFGQTVMNFAGPTSEFERLVIGRGLKHPGHPILTWQAGHVTVKTDQNNNKRPVKPPFSDPRKIDGIVASIMGLARAMLNQDEGSVYDRPGGVLAL